MAGHRNRSSVTGPYVTERLSVPGSKRRIGFAERLHMVARGHRKMAITIRGIFSLLREIERARLKLGII